MPNRPDPMEIQWRAQQATIRRLVELDRRMKAELVTRPAVGRELTKQERVDEYLSLRNDENRLRSTIQELQQRYKLPPDRPIPRRILTQLIMGEREIADLAEAPPQAEGAG